MMHDSQFLTFLITSITLNLIPGNDVMYVVTQSFASGIKGGSTAAFGIGCGIFFHIFALAIGLSELLVHYPWAFFIIKMAGIGYLVFLAIKAFKIRSQEILDLKEKQTLSQIFYKGVLTNILNPKVALFFLAFIPQFITIDNGRIYKQVLFLGFSFLCSGTLVNLGYAVLSGFFGDKMRNNLKFQNYINKFSGIVFLILSLKLLIS